MAELNETLVREAVRPVRDPAIGRSIVDAGQVKSIGIDGGKVRLALELTTPSSPHKAKIESDVKNALVSVPGVKDVAVEFTWAARKAPVAQGRQNYVPDVKNVILVGSGKGGVGKSTVAVNLAVALAQAGAKVGLLDADIYGPSIPIMLGVRNAKPKATADQKIQPVEAFGLKLISIGFFVETDQALVWRGPMIQGAVIQFFRDIQWGELDYLVIDLPPGTGDIQLTIAQQVRVAGAVIVTTPQDLALADAIKAKAMFDKVEVPILGIVENMSFFSCPGCGLRTDIFHHGGGAAAASKLGVEFLGEVPLVMAIREGGDEGKPIVAAKPDGAEAKALKDVSERVAQQLTLANLTGQATVVAPAPKSLVQIKL